MRHTPIGVCWLLYILSSDTTTLLERLPVAEVVNSFLWRPVKFIEKNMILTSFERETKILSTLTWLTCLWFMMVVGKLYHIWKIRDHGTSILWLPKQRFWMQSEITSNKTSYAKKNALLCRVVLALRRFSKVVRFTYKSETSCHIMHSNDGWGRNTKTKTHKKSMVTSWRKEVAIGKRQRKLLQYLEMTTLPVGAITCEKSIRWRNVELRSLYLYMVIGYEVLPPKNAATRSELTPLLTPSSQPLRYTSI